MTRKQIDRMYLSYVKRFSGINPSFAWIAYTNAMSNMIGFASR